MPDDRIKHLYIHIPFCRHRCGYCDFFSVAGGEKLQRPYTLALLEELEGSRHLLAPLKTVYLGGGTPTLLQAPLLERLLGSMALLAEEGAEVTVEANPETVTADVASALSAGGANRVSLGVQSFSPRLRQVLERSGSPEEVAAAGSLLRQAGIMNISLDLIYGIPGQGRQELERDLSAALALEPEHLSCYELAVKKGSSFDRRHAVGLKEARDRGRAFYEIVAATLEGAGYGWYETSNFALPGRECRHNIAYWQGRDYLGLGAGAWSTVGGRRWQNPADLDAYLAGEEARRRSRLVEELSPEAKATEKLALGLRLAGGVSAKEVAAVVDEEEAARMRRHGFIENEGDKMFLTREGRFVANEICVRLLKG